MKLTASRAIGLGFVCAMAALPVWGHPDDPKVRDREPRYEGPGYRSGARGGGLPSFEADGVTLLSWLPLPEFGNHASGNDCWGYVSPSGREYAIIGLSDGTGFVEITDPGNANIVGVIAGPNSLWRDIKVYQNYAYAVSEGGSGIQIINMSQIDSGVVTLVGTVTTGGTTATHNVAIDETSGFLYRCGGSSNGLRIYDLANPANPVFVGSWPDRYVHDAQVVTYTSGPLAGRQIAYCCSGFNGGGTDTGLDILDVTDKGNIQNLSRVIYPNRAYSHQAWLSEDRRYIYLDDELDEPAVLSTTYIFNVENPAAPFYVGSYTNGSTAVTHNLYTHEGRVYLANYRSGLRVYDASNPVSLAEIAYFDTYPGSNAASFNGAWSTYPYFPSGTVLISDIERGLFVVDVNLFNASILYPNGRPEVVAPNQATPLLIEIESTEDPVDGSVLLHASVDGGAETSVEMVEVSAKRYEGNLPAAACGSRVSYYVTAEFAGPKLTVSSPSNAPASTFLAISAGSLETVFADDFETAQPWSVVNSGLTDGAWDRGVPAGDGTRGDPTTDYDGSGQCYLTDNVAGNSDVDGGSTTLLSPVMDLSAGDGILTYARWFSNDAGSNPGTDPWVVQITSDGTTWVDLENTFTSSAWVERTFVVSEYVAPSAQVQVRFIASDFGTGSVVEAAVDAFSVQTIVCPQCAGAAGADFTGDGQVNLNDFATLATCFAGAGQTEPPASCSPESFTAADLDCDGDVDLGDFAIFSTAFSG